ncbi:MAG: RIO1 family regulatory kinase/ATPase domain-containing protein [Methanobacterium sp.]
MISRRNKVYKVKFKEINKPAVIKIYPRSSKLSIEYRNLKNLSKAGINVPKVIYKSEKCLILEYISGDLVNNMAEKQDLGS